MTDLTLNEFADVVQRSGLVSRELLKQAWQSCCARGSTSKDPQILARQLEEEGWITTWQRTRLLEGKVRGYFLGNYKLLQHLGTGGMSSVFLAVHRYMERHVAIKVLPPQRNSASSFLQRFEREARVTGRLSHPNIVRAYDIDVQDDTHFLVMEYVDGLDLKAMVKRMGPLTLEQGAYYLRQVAIGLEHAHESGVIHRDIKPSNLVVNHHHVVKILDLGLARLHDDQDEASLTLEHDERVMGTADYLAPEQARHSHDVDYRADLYSLGCTYYFLLTGAPPFPQGNVAQRMLRHQTEKPVDVRAHRTDCPHALADICMRLIEKKPVDRIRSAAEVARRLEHWLRQRDVVPSNFPSLPRETSDPIDDDEPQAPLATITLLASAPEIPPPTNMADPIPIAVSVATSDAPLDVPTNLGDDRRLRGGRRIRTPVFLWLILGASVIACLVLVSYLVLRGR